MLGPGCVGSCASARGGHSRASWIGELEETRAKARALETANLPGKDGKEEPGDTVKGPPPLESVNTGASPGWKDGSTTSETVILRALASTFPL